MMHSLEHISDLDWIAAISTTTDWMCAQDPKASLKSKETNGASDTFEPALSSSADSG
jgi:hypothetical protein